MYTKFFGYFGLRANPFNAAPDAYHPFLNQRAQDALGQMSRAIEARRGLIVLTGEVGTGKTTLINELKKWLAARAMPTAFIFNPYLEASDLFELMLGSFGVASDQSHKEGPLARLHRWLIEQYQKGTNPVAILDEAQGLRPDLLAEISILFNYEVRGEKLLQVVLCGEPELEEKLKTPGLRQIRQRISLRCQTTTLSREEAQGYIDQRLRIAGGAAEDLFTLEAIDAVYRYSGGIPRVMNLLCEHAMIQAYLHQTRPVPVGLMDEAARQLQFDVVPVGGKPVWTLDPAITYPVAKLNGPDASEIRAPFATEQERAFAAAASQVAQDLGQTTIENAGTRQQAAHEIPATPPLSAESLAKTESPRNQILQFESLTRPIPELEDELGVNETAVAARGQQSKKSMEPGKVVVLKRRDVHSDVHDFPTLHLLATKARAWQRKTGAAINLFALKVARADFPVLYSVLGRTRGWQKNLGASLGQFSKNLHNADLPRLYALLHRTGNAEQRFRASLDLLSRKSLVQLRGILGRLKSQEREWEMAFAVRLMKRPASTPVSNWISGKFKRISSIAESPAWHRNVDPLVRWLQQPLPHVKLHRRAGHSS
jgi:type II secretory pathway predicted ATPase ExeA